MKTQIKKLGITVSTLLILLLSVNAFSQACDGNQVTVAVSNMVSNPKNATIEFDVTIANTGKNTLKLASLSGALLHQLDFATGGIFTVVTQPSDADFPNFNPIIATEYAVESQQMRWTNNPVKEKEAMVLPAGVVKKFARFRFKRTHSNSTDFATTLLFQEFVKRGYTAVNAIVYCNGNSTYTALANRKRNDSKGFLIVAKNGVTDNSVHSTQAMASVSPNPFTDNFTVAIRTSGESNVEIKVYDMLGKLIDNKNVEKSQLENLVLGSNYPSGIYNATISQGENSQTLRIIKR